MIAKRKDFDEMVFGELVLPMLARAKVSAHAIGLAAEMIQHFHSAQGDELADYTGVSQHEYALRLIGAVVDDLKYNHDERIRSSNPFQRLVWKSEFEADAKAIQELSSVRSKLCHPQK